MRWGPVVALPALLLAIAFALLAQVAPAKAATLTVCRDGGLYATIQAAVDVAAAGDVIQICAGTYTESVSLPSGVGDITLEGMGTVIISPTNDSAIYVPAAQHVGSVALINLAARSADSIRMEFSDGIAGNLVISRSSAVGAGLWGLYANGITGPVWITNTLFEGSGMAGATIVSERPSVDCVIPSAIPTAISLYGVEASSNEDEGIKASTRCGNIVVASSTADDDGSDGFLLTSFEAHSGAIVTASSADDNGDPPQTPGSGFHIEANYLTMHDTSTKGNATDGSCGCRSRWGC